MLNVTATEGEEVGSSLEELVSGYFSNFILLQSLFRLVSLGRLSIYNQIVLLQNVSMAKAW